MSTVQLAKKFHVHSTTVTRTLQKRKRILEQASRVNVNFKTVQTNHRGEELDGMVLEYIRSRQEQKNEPLTIREICDKAIEYAKTLNREIKSKRGWWRRFKIRCNIVKLRLPKSSSTFQIKGTNNHNQERVNFSKTTKPNTNKDDQGESNSSLKLESAQANCI